MKSNSDISSPLPWRLILFQFALSIPVLLTIPVVAAGMTAVLVSPLSDFNGTERTIRSRASHVDALRM